jgi:HK97 family phage portal protein
LGGNAYLTGVGPTRGPFQELYCLRSDRMRVVAGDTQQMVSAYEYTQGGSTTTLDAATVMHWKTWNPLDDWYGMPPLVAAARSVDQNNAAKAHNVSLLQNGARPSGVLEVQDQLSANDLQDLRKELTDNWVGPRNSGRPVVLSGKTTWKQAGLSHADIDWLEGQKLSAREIGLVFGVPPEMLGDPDAKTYASFGEARTSLYEDTALPLAQLLAAELNVWLVPQFGKDLFLGLDEDRIPALESKRAERWTRTVDAAEKGILTINEARTALGYEDAPQGDAFLWEVTKPPAGSKPEEGKRNPWPVERREEGPTWASLDAERTETTTSEVEALQDEVAAFFGAQLGRVLEALPSLMDPATFDEAWQDVEADTESSAAGPAEQRRASPGTTLALATSIQSRTTKGLAKGQGHAASKLLVEVDPGNKRAVAWLRRKGATQAGLVQNATKRELRATLANAIVEGLTQEQAAARVRERWAGYSVERSLLIAQQEIGQAFEAGQHIAALEGAAQGVPIEKSWLTAGDDHVTPGCRSNAGAGRIPVEEVFPSGAPHPLRHVRCRCVCTYWRQA